VYEVAWQNATNGREDSTSRRALEVTGMAAGKLLYIDPWTGVAGDMLISALLDTDREGVSLDQVLRGSIAAVGLDPAIATVTRAAEGGISSLGLQVAEEGQPDFHHLADIQRVLTDSRLTPWVKHKAGAAFQKLAEIEAAVHGSTADHVHFHEVGSVDTLVDVVGAFALVEALGVEHVAVGTIPVGGGSVEIAHGRMQVPAPATAALLMGYPTVGGPDMRELTTPTGALLVGQLGAEPGHLPEMNMEAVGYGRGTMRLESGPNILRVFVGEPSAGWMEPRGSGRDTVIELETNLDDVSAEVVGYVSRLLRKAGALEVWTAPIAMKKDRQAMVLHVLAEPSLEEDLTDIIFGETGTLGIRRQAKQRRILGRGSMIVDVEGAPVSVKWGLDRGRLTSLSAEYDRASRAASATGLPLKYVMARAVEEARKMAGEQHLLP
jgi:hypothetical protein